MNKDNSKNKKPIVCNVDYGVYSCPEAECIIKKIEDLFSQRLPLELALEIFDFIERFPSFISYYSEKGGNIFDAMSNFMKILELKDTSRTFIFNKKNTSFLYFILLSSLSTFLIIKKLKEYYKIKPSPDYKMK